MPKQGLEAGNTTALPYLFSLLYMHRAKVPLLILLQVLFTSVPSLQVRACTKREAGGRTQALSPPPASAVDQEN